MEEPTYPYHDTDGVRGGVQRDASTTLLTRRRIEYAAVYILYGRPQSMYINEFGEWAEIYIPCTISFDLCITDEDVAADIENLTIQRN